MSSSYYDLTGCIIFCAKQSERYYQVGLYTERNEFLGSTQLNVTEGNILVPDGIVARKGFGKSFHRLLVDIATDLGFSLAIVRDGDARGGALSVWTTFYEDESLDKSDISHLPDEIDWVSIEECPEFFHAYRSTRNRYVRKDSISYYDHIPSDIAPRVKEGMSIFGCSYDIDSNLWIDEEYPLSKIPPRV